MGCPGVELRCLIYEEKLVKDTLHKRIPYRLQLLVLNACLVALDLPAKKQTGFSKKRKLSYVDPTLRLNYSGFGRERLILQMGSAKFIFGKPSHFLAGRIPGQVSPLYDQLYQD
jgi:hypothetical protein